MDNVTVKILGKAVFLSFTMNGVKKQGMTDREGLRQVITKAEAALRNPMSNVNGKTVGNVRHD